MRDKLFRISCSGDIFPEYINTPIEKLIRYHNFGQKYDEFENAEILVGMCMDNRKYLKIPDNFAFILRTGGGNLRSSEFKVSYAVAIGKIRYIALIAHNHCGMVGLAAKKDKFIKGLTEIGWDETAAADHFNSFAPMFEIGNEIDFVIGEAKRLSSKYDGVTVVPLYYNLDDNRLWHIED